MAKNALRALVQQIDAVLPQTQCQRCGYDACLPYATAIAKGEAAINRCPPGGQKGIATLAKLLSVAEIPLDTSCGVEQNLHWAVIDAKQCIGCTLCIDACPVDAIAGVAKHLHVVLEQRCNGCALCLPPCPVDCITLNEAQPIKIWQHEDAQTSRRYFEAKNLRQQSVPPAQLSKPSHTSSMRPSSPPSVADAVAFALQRAQVRLADQTKLSVLSDTRKVEG